MRSALQPLPGVRDLKCDVLNARIRITYDESRIRRSDIEAAVARTGMRVHLLLDTQDRRKPESTLWERWGRTTTTAISGLLVLAGFIAHSSVAGWHLAVGGHEAAMPLLPRVFYLGAVLKRGMVHSAESLARPASCPSRHEPADDGRRRRGDRHRRVVRGRDRGVPVRALAGARGVERRPRTPGDRGTARAHPPAARGDDCRTATRPGLSSGRSARRRSVVVRARASAFRWTDVVVEGESQRQSGADHRREPAR